MTQLSRRHFMQGASLVGLGLLAGCGGLPGQARQPKVLPRIGLLSPVGPQPYHEELWQGLRDLGYLEGRNIAIERRYAEGHDDRLVALAAELVHLPVDVVITGGTPAALAAKNATDTIPIVLATSVDPVGDGLVAGLSRPGGNVTGLSVLQRPLSAKRLELLRETVPNVSRVAVLWNPQNPANVAQWRATQGAAEMLGLSLLSLEAGAPDQLDAALTLAVREHADALITLDDPAVTSGERRRIVDLAASNRLPAMYHQRQVVDVGGLMAYGASLANSYRRAAYYVDRILKGAKPADLPVEQPMTFDFVINLKSAQALGLNIPRHVLLQATEIIQ